MPMRVAETDYRRMTTRIFLERITLQQLAAMSCHLREGDATLTLSEVSLTARGTTDASFDADVAISYLIYAPRN